jgi:glycosyltransferase involved in cell wall biosynthesis
MKIGFITPFFSPVAGGSAIAPYYLAKYLVRKGHEIFIFTSDFGRNLAKFNDEKDLIIIESNIKLKMFNLFYTPSLRSKLENYKLDVLHFHNFRTYQNYVAYSYAKRTNKPYILQAHGTVPRISSWRKLKFIYDIFFGYKLLRNASKIIALNKIEFEQYKSMGVSEEKIVIIPNGLDLSEYANLPSKGFFKKKFNIPEDKKIILYLGRIHKIKGIDFLIKAYAYLKNKMNFKDAILVIAGPDNEYLDEARALARTLEVTDSVIFLEPLYGKNKLAAYVDSDLYVIPSRYEIWGMTVLEAYACGKPVVASRVSGLKDLVKDGETGSLFEPGNVKQLAISIFNLLNGNDIAKEMGLKGKNFVRENFTIEKVVERLEKVYEKVVER